MELTQEVGEIRCGALCRRGLVLASGALASVLLLGCSTEPEDGLNDTSQPQTAAAALQASSPTLAPSPAQQKPSAGASADVTITFNHAPQVTNVLSDVGRLDAGESAQLNVSAHDLDGDRLTYAWTTECKGSFDRPLHSAPVFTLDTLPAQGSCSLVVTVADGHGGENLGILTLAAAPATCVTVADTPNAP